jgi:hypothetical protein
MKFETGLSIVSLKHFVVVGAIVAAIVGLGSFAQAKQQSIECSVPGLQWANLNFQLDDAGLTKDSGLTEIVAANWYYEYSGATLICNWAPLSLTNGNLTPLSCVGYLMGRGLIEVKGHLENGAGSFIVHNIDKNPYASETEGLAPVCVLRNE